MGLSAKRPPAAAMVGRQSPARRGAHGSARPTCMRHTNTRASYPSPRGAQVHLQGNC